MKASRDHPADVAARYVGCSGGRCSGSMRWRRGHWIFKRDYRHPILLHIVKSTVVVPVTMSTQQSSRQQDFARPIFSLLKHYRCDLRQRLHALNAKVEIVVG